MKTYSVTFQGFHKRNLTVSVQAEDMFMARTIAKFQNPGWSVVLSVEVA